MAMFQLYWWRKTSSTLPDIISGTKEHLSKTIIVLKAMR
jgi:hypothetical protein